MGGEGAAVLPIASIPRSASAPETGHNSIGPRDG